MTGKRKVRSMSPKQRAAAMTMTPEERETIVYSLICAIKELGEIAECLIKDDRPDHWKNELGDLCDTAIQPLLDLAEINFDDACRIGLIRKRGKIAK